MAKFVSEKIRKKSGARLAAVQAAYMAAFSGLSVDEVVEDFLKGEIGRYAIEEDGLSGEHLVELEEMDKPYFEKIGVACPKCGKDIVIKKTKKGRKYYGCIGNPDCDFMVWQKPSAEKCPKCGSMMLQKGNKLVCMNEECGFIK